MADERNLIKTLLDHAGTTYAEQAGIRLKDSPAPLYRLLVLSILLSTRIKADIAVDAARALADAGMGTPEKMRKASWQDRVDALGRASYKRYDESTATALGDGAELVHAEYGDDLRKLRERADRDPKRIRKALTGFPRLGPGGGVKCTSGTSVPLYRTEVPVVQRGMRRQRMATATTRPSAMWAADTT